jgi:hypothetical protein
MDSQVTTYDWGALRAPFRADEIEWRVARAGKNDKGPWALVLAYMTSRAVQDRLDAVVGPENWQTAFREIGSSMSAGLGLRIGSEWVWKWDGAGHLATSDGLDSTDAGKGDYSNALKRVAVQWGVGRYLYHLPEGFAAIRPDGANYGRLPKKDGGDSFRWDPPGLPKWALPGGSGKPDPGDTIERGRAPQAGSQPTGSGATTQGAQEHTCPQCGTSGVWDNRQNKRNPKAPDWKCKDKDCDWALWIDGARKALEEALGGLVAAGVVTEQAKAHTMAGTEAGDLATLQAAAEWVERKRDEGRVTGAVS